MQNTGRCQGYRNSLEIRPLFLRRSVLGAMPPGQRYHRDVSGGPAGWGTPHCLEEAGKTSLDGDSRAGLPRVSFQLLCCRSFLEGTKDQGPSSSREYSVVFVYEGIFKVERNTNKI